MLPRTKGCLQSMDNKPDCHLKYSSMMESQVPLSGCHTSISLVVAWLVPCDDLTLVLALYLTSLVWTLQTILLLHPRKDLIGWRTQIWDNTTRLTLLLPLLGWVEPLLSASASSKHTRGSFGKWADGFPFASQAGTMRGCNLCMNISSSFSDCIEMRPCFALLESNWYWGRTNPGNYSIFSPIAMQRLLKVIVDWISNGTFEPFGH